MTYTAITLRDGADVLRFRLKRPITASSWRQRIGAYLVTKGTELLGIPLELEESSS